MAVRSSSFVIAYSYLGVIVEDRPHQRDPLLRQTTTTTTINYDQFSTDFLEVEPKDGVWADSERQRSLTRRRGKHPSRGQY